MTATDLETRYRNAVRWYPKRWRARYESAMIGTLLESADDQGRTEPANGELFSLRAGGVMNRLGLVVRWIPAPVRDRAASIVLGLGASMGAAGIAYNLILPPRIEAVVAGAAAVRWSPNFFGPFGSDAVVLYAIWVVAGLLAVLGLNRSAKIAVALTIPSAIVLRATSDQLQQLLAASSTTLVSLELLALVVLAGSATRARSSRLTVLITFLASCVLTTLAGLLSYRPSFYAFGYTRDGFTQIDATWLMVVAPLALAAAAVLAQTKFRTWAGAISIVIIPTGLMLALAGGDAPQLENAVIGIAVAGIVVAGVWALLRLFGYRVIITRAPHQKASR